MLTRRFAPRGPLAPDVQVRGSAATRSRGAGAFCKPLFALSLLTLGLAAAGCGGSGGAGSPDLGTGGSLAPSSSGGATSSGTGGSTATTSSGSGGVGVSTGTGGRPGLSESGGAGPGSGSGGTVSSGGAVGSGGAGNPVSSGGSGGGPGATAGKSGQGGATGGAAGAAAVATGGAGPAVMVSPTCKIPTWPTATGTPVMITGTKMVTGVYDGKMALHDGTLNDCSTGDQSSTDALIEVADGGTVKNVIMGNKVGDGIHCKGSCTIGNVWFPYICDDAISALGDNATVTISNSGFKNARDKTLQHNGNNTTVVIDNVYVETAGKLIRSCGMGGGCGPTSSKRMIKVSNVVAVGVGQVVGVSTNDTATLTNICTYRTPQICHVYQPGSDNDATVGANAVGEGPSANCVYKATDAHALVDKVAGAVSTDIPCPGPNSVKTGATATACVTGFESCLKGCSPGSYGFKQVGCAAGKYADGGGASCTLPVDTATAAHFAATNTASATATVTSNGTCTTQWSWGKDSSGKYCMCVLKPGYYQQSSTSWTVWDCQSQWF